MDNYRMKIQEIIGWIGIFAVVTGAFFTCRPREKVRVEYAVDTVIVDRIIPDTILIPQKVYIARYDTVYLQMQGDTVYQDVIVPIERKEYRTDNYYAVVEGFKPNLVSMEVYQKTAYITNTETVTRMKKPRFGVGVQVGYGYMNNKASPYIGVGIQYNLFTF